MLYLCNEKQFKIIFNMVKKIIQVSDIHIPNSCEHRPFNEMLMSFLKQLYKNEIEGNNPDEIRIVIVGDIFDQKIKATNEAKDMFHTMLNYLNQMCRTYIVAGNHDMLENNTDRMDSINPTFEIDGVYPNITYLDRFLDFKSGFVEDDNIVWALYSMHDKFASPQVSKNDYPENKIIGLYHGDVQGAVTDIGRMCENGIDTSLFEECDCVMAGHIHKYQTLKKEGVPIVYSGSLFQKDAGENTTGHGYVVWNIEDMSHKLIEIPNKYRIFKFSIDNYSAFSDDTEELINL